jgi:hypothetical protein
VFGERCLNLRVEKEAGSVIKTQELHIVSAGLFLAPRSCYKSEMAKTIERWLLYQYVPTGHACPCVPSTHARLALRILTPPPHLRHF